MICLCLITHVYTIPTLKISLPSSSIPTQQAHGVSSFTHLRVEFETTCTVPYSARLVSLLSPSLVIYNARICHRVSDPLPSFVPPPPV